MRAIRFLLRHRVTRWRRDPRWGTGTVAGQVVLVGLLVLLLAPLGLGSYVLGDVLRELFPEADAVALINAGMLYLVPVLMASRFLLQSPPSERVASYAVLPVSRRGLLNGQALLSLLSVHTVFAVVLVVPVWAAEVATAWSPVAAGAWLATALLLTVAVPSHGAILLHLLLGQRPWGFVGALAGIALCFVADAGVGPDLFRGLSRLLFGRPEGGLIATACGVGSTHALMIRVMRARLEVDRRTVTQIGGPSRRAASVYQWIEQTLPAGTLVALELRQVVRTRRLRGATATILGLMVLFYGWAGAQLVMTGTVESEVLMNIVLLGIGGPFFAIGYTVYGISAGHIDGLFARPTPLLHIAISKLALLWAGLIPATLLLPTLLPWVPLRYVAFLVGCTLYWWGVMVPSTVYFGPRFRTPVDLSASHFSMNPSGSMRGLVLLPPLLVLIASPILAETTGAWWIVGGSLCAVGVFGIGGAAWRPEPFAQQLNRHRHAMLKAFRENEPI
ncbi:hypothetical protein GGP57_000718 [Salinibacter ruber]|uniref:DUF5687 family protein n=1 Tax=Salinibacter ruber TaxID=146919 RepID=UPI0021679887|nr:DUF5687 family protein [Salinibacter ruber]MCS3633427.1 hypothetical protein [Salinibacter ruber]MCS3712797.1 hypothetical protein [Salinibacter ruber]